MLELMILWWKVEVVHLETPKPQTALTADTASVKVIRLGNVTLPAVILKTLNQKILLLEE